MTQSLELHHFDPKAKTYLVTDASHLHGLGFLLMQSSEGPTKPDRIIQCGSRVLTLCESNYATIELEMLAVQWGMEKCQFYLKGMENFTVATDHHPLIGIFRKSISDLTNPRLARMRERMMEFSFEITWLEGKKNIIADVFSRNPSESTCTKEYCIKQYLLSPSNIAKEIVETANNDPDYIKIKKAISTNMKLSDLWPDHPARQLRNVWHEASIMDDGLICISSHCIYSISYT